MTACADVADYEWLTGNEACALVEALVESRTPLHTAVARLRGQVSPARTHLLIEQVELRRRASAKFTAAERMFFTRIGLEQATDEWVARYKASRFAVQLAESRRAGASAPPAVADLCCGIGGDLLALAEQGTACGIDRDLVAAHFAAINTGAPVHVLDAREFDLANVAAWHIDPDRRPTGKRTTSLAFCEPSLMDLERMLAVAPHAAVKLAPATKMPQAWEERCELEWISRDRECRQLVAWHGELATSPGHRRATILAAAVKRGVPTPAPLRTFTGAPHEPTPLTPELNRYIFDIDPAVLAAGLKGALAAEHNLAALDAGPTYLTGPAAIDDPALTSFEVLEVLPLKPKTIAAHLRERGIGQLEIKKRGLELDPEKLRRELKLRGGNAATLLVARISGRVTAVVARRVG